jgi:hypothetical protein
VSGDDDHPQDNTEPTPQDQPLSDTQAELHEEGKALSNDERGPSQRLSDILEKGDDNA